MKTWYVVVCDQHKEYLNFFVNNPTTTAFYLSDHDQTIDTWLGLHYGCELRLSHEALQPYHDLVMSTYTNVLHPERKP